MFTLAQYHYNTTPKVAATACLAACQCQVVAVEGPAKAASNKEIIATHSRQQPQLTTCRMHACFAAMLLLLHACIQPCCCHAQPGAAGQQSGLRHTRCCWEAMYMPRQEGKAARLTWEPVLAAGSQAGKCPNQQRSHTTTMPQYKGGVGEPGCWELNVCVCVGALKNKALSQCCWGSRLLLGNGKKVQTQNQTKLEPQGGVLGSCHSG